MYSLIFNLVLTRIDPETAHRVSFLALKMLDRLGWGTAVAFFYGAPRRKPTEVMGLKFPNRVGLAAGFDKNANGVRALTRIGFGHIEVGTITAHSQPGNPRPRLFRLKQNKAILNRMGFNNVGCRKAALNLKKQRRLLESLPESRRPIVGVNIGKTKVVDSAHAVADYATSARFLAPFADYLVINVSSPNTPGLRDLQAVETLRPIVNAVKETVAEVVPVPRSTLGHVPLLIKIAPDLSDEDVLAVTDMCLDAGVDGLICTNTTIDRTTVRGAERQIAQREAGGISGVPVAARSLEVLRLVKARAGSRLTLISAGGVEKPRDARARFAAGADLVQGYTGVIYAGPSWARRLVKRA